MIYHVPLCVLNVMPATLGIVIAAMRARHQRHLASSEEVVNYLPRLLKNARPMQEARSRADRMVSVFLNFIPVFDRYQLLLGQCRRLTPGQIE